MHDAPFLSIWVFATNWRGASRTASVWNDPPTFLLTLRNLSVRSTSISASIVLRCVHLYIWMQSATQQPLCHSRCSDSCSGERQGLKRWGCHPLQTLSIFKIWRISYLKIKQKLKKKMHRAIVRCFTMAGKMSFLKNTTYLTSFYGATLEQRKWRNLVKRRRHNRIGVIYGHFFLLLLLLTERVKEGEGVLKEKRISTATNSFPINPWQYTKYWRPSVARRVKPVSLAGDTMHARGLKVPSSYLYLLSFPGCPRNQAVYDL